MLKVRVFGEYHGMEGFATNEERVGRALHAAQGTMEPSPLGNGQTEESRLSA